METRPEKHADCLFTVTVQCVVLLQLIFTNSVYLHCMNIKTTRDAASEKIRLEINRL
jgi:hypothetical protein